MILLGSRALFIRAKQILLREPKDFDFLCSQEEYQSWLEENESKIKPSKIYPYQNKMIVEGNTNCEFEIIQPNTSSELADKLISSDPESIDTPFGKIPNLDMLFTFKTSHRYKKNSPHFWKTVADWHLMKSIGAQVRPEYEAFLKLREKETYNYSHPKLNQSKENFFKDDNISYVYDHDDIHKSVALYDRPAYTYYLKDGSPVMTDKNKFFACERKIQLAGVIEEAAVLAIERSLVPHPGVKTPHEAWKFALSKVCSSITSGYFRQFGYENILEILKLYPKNYWNKFQHDVDSGLIKFI